MELEIPEIKEILSKIEKLQNTMSEERNQLSSQWYNDEQCWTLKGGMALATYRSNRFYQVKGGIPDGYVGGRKVWSRESVMEWLPLTDSELESYHLKYKTGAKKKA